MQKGLVLIWRIKARNHSARLLSPCTSLSKQVGQQTDGFWYSQCILELLEILRERPPRINVPTNCWLQLIMFEHLH